MIIFIFLITTECLFLIMVRQGYKNLNKYSYLNTLFQPQRILEGDDRGGQRTQDYEDYDFEFKSPSRERLKTLLKDRASLIFESIIFMYRNIPLLQKLQRLLEAYRNIKLR